MTARRRSPVQAAAFLSFVALVVVGPALALAQVGETPPPTPVPVPGGGTSPSPFPTALRTPDPSVEPPPVSAASAVLVDLDTGQVLFEHEATERRPIASLTKIMTALLVLERLPADGVVTVSERAAGTFPIGTAQLGLAAGEQVAVPDLLFALLLQSANDAALALAEHVSGTVEAFVADMNRRAERLGLRDTRFFSPNGLDDRGYSTALDVAELTRAAYAEAAFGQIVGTRFHEVPAPSGKPRVVQNRNALLWLYPGATGVKTGFTTAAGFCVVAAAEREDLRLVAVVLGSGAEAFSDAAALLDHGFEAFERRELVTSGESFGTVGIDGRRVPVAAARSLDGLVPVDAVIAERVRVRSDVAFPPGVGEQVAAVVVSTPELRLGRVPLVVVEVPGPPRVDDRPWWLRAASAFAGAAGSVFGALFG